MNDYFAVEKTPSGINWSELVGQKVRVTIKEKNAGDDTSPNRSWELIGIFLGYFREDASLTLAFQGHSLQVPTTALFTIKKLGG